MPTWKLFFFVLFLFFFLFVCLFFLRNRPNRYSTCANFIYRGASWYRSIFARFLFFCFFQYGLLESKNKMGGNHVFFRDKKAAIILKTFKRHKNVCFFFQIEAWLSLKSVGLPPIFFLVSGLEFSYGKNFRIGYRDLGNRASPPSHMNTSNFCKE